MASPAVEGSEEKKKKMITLMSKDGEEFEVEEAVAMASEILSHMIDDECADNIIPLPNVHSSTLAKVIEYCNKHAAAGDETKSDGNDDASGKGGEDLKTWDANFVPVEQAALFDLIMAANYLEIKGLLNLTCQTVADMIKNKTPEQIRKTFNIKNDFTAEEEAEIRKENAWAFDD